MAICYSFVQKFQNKAQRSMNSENFEIFQIIRFWSTFVYRLNLKSGLFGLQGVTNLSRRKIIRVFALKYI